MMKVGIIGCGSISGSHMNGYKKLREEGVAELVAYCDIREEKLTKFADARTYTDIDAFLEKEKGQLDYVDICLPTYLHAEVSIKAMKAGFNVLCEKPMALNAKEAEAMIAASKETGKQLMVAHCMRFCGVGGYIKGLMETGELGKLRSVEFWREGGSTGPMGYQNWFRNGKLSGGATLDLHIHDVDVANWLLGMPKAVSVSAISIMTENGYDCLSANYIYDDDIVVNLKCDWSIAHDKFNTRGARFNFEKGYIFHDRTSDRKAFVKVDLDGNVTDLWDKFDGDFYTSEIRYFIDCLENNKPVSFCPPEQSAEAVRIVMAEIKSADLLGEKVTL